MGAFDWLATMGGGGGNPYGIGGPANPNPVLPPEAYGRSGPPPGFTSSTAPAGTATVPPRSSWAGEEAGFDPSTLNDPLPRMGGIDITGGLPSGDYQPGAGRNVPLGDWLSNFIFGNRFYTNAAGSPGGSYGSPGGPGDYTPPQWLQDAGYPDLSNMSPVMASGPGGGGGYQPWQQTAIASAAAQGFGSGMLSGGGGEWQPTTADVLSMLGGNMASPFLLGGGGNWRRYL